MANDYDVPERYEVLMQIVEKLQTLQSGAEINGFESYVKALEQVFPDFNPDEQKVLSEMMPKLNDILKTPEKQTQLKLIDGIFINLNELVA